MFILVCGLLLIPYPVLMNSTTYFIHLAQVKKTIPLNIGELLTSLGLVYWLSDDGTFNKRDKLIRIATNSFTFEEVNLLLDTLRKKFNLNCKAIKDSTGYVIHHLSKFNTSFKGITRTFNAKYDKI